MEIAAQGRSDVEIVLDRSYQVISHSDRGEVGKNYSAEDGSFGAALVSRLRRQSAEENHFSLRYGSAEYIVYAMTIENNWICVSVTDATAALARLRIPLILTVLAAVGIIGSLGEEDYAIGFRKADQALRDAVQEIIYQMNADGTLSGISRRWFGSDITSLR